MGDERPGGRKESGEKREKGREKTRMKRGKMIEQERGVRGIWSAVPFISNPYSGYPHSHCYLISRGGKDGAVRP